MNNNKNGLNLLEKILTSLDNSKLNLQNSVSFAHTLESEIGFNSVNSLFSECLFFQVRSKIFEQSVDKEINK